MSLMSLQLDLETTSLHCSPHDQEPHIRPPDLFLGQQHIFLLQQTPSSHSLIAVNECSPTVLPKRLHREMHMWTLEPPKLQPVA